MVNVKVMFDTTNTSEKVAFLDYMIKYANGNIKIIRNKHYKGYLKYTPNFKQEVVDVFNYEAEEIFKMLSQFIF